MPDMKDSQYARHAIGVSVKQPMGLHALGTHAVSEIRARDAQFRCIGKLERRLVNLIEIPFGLRGAPCVRGVLMDAG